MSDRADGACVAGLARESELCAERDRLTAGLIKILVRLRRTCLGFFGREGLGARGLADPIKQGPVEAVCRQAYEAAEGLQRPFDRRGTQSPVDPPLRDPEREPKDADDPDLEPWLAARARDLETRVREVEQILLEIKKERDAGEARTELRKQAIADFDRHYLGIGRIVEAMLRLIGRTEEADRIHPSTRKLDRSTR